MDALQNYYSYPNSKLRKATDNDIAKLVLIINDAYSYQDSAKGQQRTSHDHLAKRIAETDFFVIEVTGVVVGCVYIDPRGRSLHFGLLTIVTEYRGTGLAGAVIGAIELFAKDKYVAVELDYMSLAPWLKKYYEKYGYAETGTVEAWGTIDLIRMKKALSY